MANHKTCNESKVIRKIDHCLIVTMEILKELTNIIVLTNYF